MALALFRRDGPIRSLDKRRRKYLSTKCYLRLSPFMSERFVRKLERRLVKYGPATAANREMQAARTTRGKKIAADILRLARSEADD